MPNSKTMNKIIRYKQHNRKLSALLKHTIETGEDICMQSGKYFSWTRWQIGKQMMKNSSMILSLREKMSKQILVK